MAASRPVEEGGNGNAPADKGTRMDAVKTYYRKESRGCKQSRGKIDPERGIFAMLQFQYNTGKVAV